MQKNRIALLLFICLFVIGFVVMLMGCGSGSGSSSKNDVSPESTIPEVDANYDGVRDDIKQYIDDTYPPSPQRESLTQYAEAVQNAYSNVTTVEEAQNAEQKIIQSLANITAAGEISGSDAPSLIVDHKTINTPERLAEQLRYEALLDGKVFTVSSVSDISESSTVVVSNSNSSPYLVVYINGINTLKSNARHDAMTVLAPAIGSTHNNKGVGFVVAYNKTNGVMDDLVDVFRQKLNEYPGISGEMLLRAITTAVFNELIPGPLQHFITQYHVNKIQDYGYVSYDDSDLRDILDDIREKMTRNQIIVLVPHSQGNVYANEVFRLLTNGRNSVPTDSIGIVGIASPAAYVAGEHSDYVTSSNDLVIKLLRESGLSVLPSNFTISHTNEDYLGHSMEKVYLNSDLEGRAKISKKIHECMDSLSFPNGDGSGTVVNPNPPVFRPTGPIKQL